MNVLLRKITIISDQEIQVLNENIEKTYFGKNRIKESIATETMTYEYWVEFHVDQCRFYYGERKPEEIPNRKGLYTYVTNTSHTKNGLDDSLKIITGITKRTKLLFPDWEIKLYQISNISTFQQFDKKQSD